MREGFYFYARKGLRGKYIYLPKSRWNAFERAAKKKGWSFRQYMSWFLAKNAPK